MANAISVKNLNLVLNNEKILNDVSIDFSVGKIHGILGRNGSGKSMMFKCICGFILPDSGEITVLGQKVGNGGVDFPKNVGMIIENPGFIPYYSGFKNLKMLAQLSGIDSDDVVNDLLKTVGLEHAKDKHVRKYSMGMKQRLAIAQAIMGEPKILILDEPFNGLDKEGVEEIRRILMDFRDRGNTILLASHNPEDINIMCDEKCEMDKGILTKIQ